MDRYEFLRYTEDMAKRSPRHPVLSPEALDLVAARFAALSDPKRLRILNTLMQGEHSVQEIAQATGLEQPNVSRHLGLLRKDGIVHRRQEGNRAIYSIQDPTVVQLCDIVCGGLAVQLTEGLEALPERRRTRKGTRASR